MLATALDLPFEMLREAADYTRSCNPIRNLRSTLVADSAPEIVEMWELYSSGLSLETVGEKFDVNGTLIAIRLRADGHEVRPSNTPKMVKHGTEGWLQSTSKAQ